MHGDSIPIWDSAIIEGKKYVVHSTLVETLPYQVGTRKSDKRLVSIKADPDTKMYVLDFDATGEVESTPDPKNKNAAIVLTTRIMGRKITYKILTEVELE